MKKKNKIENSLERLFSAKKSDLANNPEDNAETSQSQEISENAQQVKIKPESKPKPASETKKPVNSKKEADKPANPKKAPETNTAAPADIASPPVPEPPLQKEAPKAAEQSARQPDEKKEDLAVSNKPKTEIDKPMTDAIVAKKSDLDYDNDEHLVIFSLDQQSYGISIMIVESIIKMQAITHVPRAHFSIEGATNLRGVVLPVIDLCKKLSLPASDDMDNKRIIVVSVEDITAGFVVDNVQSVFRIPAKDIAPPSPMVSAVNIKYIKGIAKNGENGLVIILDPIKIFESVIMETSDKNQIHLIK